LRAAARPRVKLERPQPVRRQGAGEDERAWRRWAAADDRKWGKPAWLWLAVDEASAGGAGFPGRCV